MVDAVAMRYRTIVADPPWPYAALPSLRHKDGGWSARPLPYQSMPVDEICNLLIPDTDCAKDSRLFLWTTNHWMESAFKVMAAWGFSYRQMLVWEKPPGPMVGPVARLTAEFLLVGARGKPPRNKPLDSAVIRAAQVYGTGEHHGPLHSAKPELFLDLIEQVSPGPYLELFARRNRLGWDTWGNESLEMVQL